MKRNVWLINHYATSMYEGGGRHLYFAKYLKEKGYNPIILCSSFQHKGTDNYILKDEKYRIEEKWGIPFVFIKTNSYYGNGRKRVANMIEFYRGVLKTSNRIAQELGKPDVVIGSSVHPLSCIAGIRLGKKFKCKAITEIRDLWPETLVMFGTIKESGLIARILYAGEKWIYKKSDDIIFTMEGGKQYIIDKGWNKSIDLSKVHYINNGVDLKQFDSQKESEAFEDTELDNDIFKVIYTGTISRANGVGRLLQAFEQIQKTPEQKLSLLLYGDGEERLELEQYCRDNKIENIHFKGKVCKSKIPYILSKGNVLIVNYAKEIFESKHNVLRYGGSHNKLFEYLAAGKAILYAQPSKYNLVEKYQCGLVLNDDDELSTLVDGILKLYNLKSDEYEMISKNARAAAFEFDFHKLTEKLVEVIEK